MIRALLSFMLVLLLSGCGAGNTGFVRLGDYECDASEAVVRELIKTLPDVTNGVPREFCLVKALDLRAMDLDFVRRFDDLKLPFVSGDVLSEQLDTHYPINPKSGVSPVLLQLRHLTQPDAHTYEIEAGWAYKRTFQMNRYRVQQTGNTWNVRDVARIEGNYEPTTK